MRATVAYDGTDFAGFQRQPDGAGRTVQGELERALADQYGQRVTVHGAGRTDAGVHARGQVIAFYVGEQIPAERVAQALSGRLPRDIGVRQSSVAPPGFDPRRHALSRVYRYTLVEDRLREPLRDRFTTRVRPGLDVARMIAAGEALLGAHDFGQFCADEEPGKNTRRTLSRLSWSRTGELLTVELEAQSFLRKQVRCIMGVLLAVGRRQFGPELVGSMLAGEPRPPQVAVAKPYGLVLERVVYASEAGTESMG